MTHFNLAAILLVFFQASLLGQSGIIQDNTNLALPTSYNFKEYVYAEPNDQGACVGNSNNTASTGGIYVSQTHRIEVGHPLFFMIGERPALLQVAVTGSGLAPDVKVEGILNNISVGVLCLKGPASLSVSVDESVPNLDDYFTVTLPKSWIKNGLELELTIGENTQVIDAESLNIGPYTEMNMVMVNMDMMDYNSAPHDSPIFDDFLEELASAIPASVVRFGVFPETLVFPEVVASNNTEQLVRLSSRTQLGANQINDEGSINSITSEFLSNMHQSTEDYVSTVYFGNTLNLAPGGWGGGKSFVGPDYTDIFIHELGHALSLPHWGEYAYGNTDNNENEYIYPYGGHDQMEGGGRGSSWNFIQDGYEFVNTNCEAEGSDNLGFERSDCMQRNFSCIETRPSGSGPWDGFGDFSAYAMYRYLTGAVVKEGQVMDRGINKAFRLNTQEGFPRTTLVNGKRTYTRDPLQPQDPIGEEAMDLPGEVQLNQDVYLIYGTTHETQSQANIVYRPISYNGTLPPIIDPTDPVTFEALKGEQYFDVFYTPKDIVLKMYYDDGSVLHALNPYHSFARAPYEDGFGIFRYDLCNFSLVVPREKSLTKVEMYHRPFCTQWEDLDTPGNINYEFSDITAENFMDDAVYITEYNFNGSKVLGSNTIGNRVWHDQNRNGIQDSNEKGIAGVSLVLWSDDDNDGDPTDFNAVAITDDQGYYSFGGLEPGAYKVFVWSVDNWEEGEVLFGLEASPIFEPDPNNDSNVDNNGISVDFEPFIDLFSGVILLTADGEPRDDGDRLDDWFDYDPSGNMTIDFGFYNPMTTSTENVPDIEIDENCISLFPNPVENQFTISGTNDSYSIEILSSDGSVHEDLSSIALPHIFDITTLPSGLFFIKILNESNNKISLETIVKL